jgi:hypothetical protein
VEKVRAFSVGMGAPNTGAFLLSFWSRLALRETLPAAAEATPLLFKSITMHFRSHSSGNARDSSHLRSLIQSSTFDDRPPWLSRCVALSIGTPNNRAPRVGMESIERALFDGRYASPSSSGKATF